jgi:hypothetical protein
MDKDIQLIRFISFSSENGIFSLENYFYDSTFLLGSPARYKRLEKDNPSYDNKEGIHEIKCGECLEYREGHDTNVLFLTSIFKNLINLTARMNIDFLSGHFRFQRKA